MPCDSLVGLSSAEFRRLSEMLKALRAPIEKSYSNFFFKDEFFEEFSSRLLAQHKFLGNPLMQESFDSAFIASAKTAGMSVSKAPDGQRFWDVNINGKNLSLKTTKAKNLKSEILHISKLTEAAWKQDCRTANARMEFTRRLFEQYTQNVNSIFQLRYFRPSDTYELVKIPCDLFNRILKVSKKHYASDGPSINIPIGKTVPDFTLKLDRSDAKITIANILKERCVVHARWKIKGPFNNKCRKMAK